MNVAIIGASLSGLYSAYLLAKEGVTVGVYDRIDRLGFPPRTLIVTSKLNEVLGFVPEEAILNRVRRFEIFSRSKRVGIELSDPDLVIERERLIQLLAHQAEEAGAKIVLGYQFEGFFRVGKKIVVNLRNRQTEEMTTILADILVGADGVSSAVAQAISQNGHYPTTLIQARVAMSGDEAPDTCRVWFDSDQTRYFFWSIPESKEFATVGLIADGDREARESLEVFLKGRGLRPLGFQEARVPLHRLRLTGGGDGWERTVFLVGDAAAQVKVTTVGGVVTGFYGAKALVHALLNGGNYRRELRGLQLELDLHLLIRQILNRFNNEEYDRLLERIDGGLKGILQKWNRDELRSFFLKMVLKKPQLLHLGLKALLRSIYKKS